jgi:hypothetical protein
LAGAVTPVLSPCSWNVGAGGADPSAAPQIVEETPCGSCDAELAADGVDIEPSGAVGEEPAPTGGESDEQFGVAVWLGGEEGDGGIGEDVVEFRMVVSSARTASGW